MSQISRPFQIALVAIVALALVWLVFLRGHSSSSESASSTAPSSAQPAKATQPSSSASASSGSNPGGSSVSSSPYHGSAPGVAGLTRAIAKARGAVAQTEQHDKRLQRKADQAENGAGASAPSSSHASAPATSAPSTAVKAPRSTAAPQRAAQGVPVMQTKVEDELKHGKLVAILLWNAKGSVDQVVRRELSAARRGARGLVVHVATSGQVGSFGTFTRAVQVSSTPTILLITPKGVTSSITGLTDAYAIQQAISEARQP
ncbi:MAG: hypothetical protein ACYDHT_08990 [Solirubrobacteraceae bacterium]